MANEENLKPWQPGQSGNPAGRARKYVSTLKEQGYKLSEVNDCIQTMMSMELPELQEVENNPKSTILELTIAKAMIKSMNNGSLYSMETLLSRVYGKPVEKKEEKVTGEIKITATFNEEEKKDT